METIRLDGAMIRKLLAGGVQGLRTNMEEINDLNVFPVPDGDTGVNMTKTLEGGLARLQDEDTVGAHLANFSKGCVLGARGNSGVILSQYIAGVAGALTDCESVSVTEFAQALEAGVARAYHAVANPVEGTILTVFRESSEYTVKNVNEDTTAEQMFEILIGQARLTLAKTKEMLPVLAQADVVDSGGAGYLAMLVGMYDALTGKEITAQSYNTVAAEAKPGVNYDLFTTDSPLEWGYCTEVLVRLQKAKGDPEAFDLDGFRADLEAKDCNSIVALRDGDVLKVHAHTMVPADVLLLCQKYGEYLEVKIENMSLQHSERTVAEQKKKIHKPYGVITVASGEGMHALFSELGADIIIDGGQTSNPSAQDFVDAIEQLDVDHVIVLPNNGNILLTAHQAASLCEGVDVRVVPTKSFPQGYSALAVFNAATPDADDQISDMTDAKDAVVSGEITYAIRDTVIGDVDVKKGESIGILDGELVCSCADEYEAMIKMIGTIEDIEDREILTLFVGDGVSEQERVAMTEAIEETYEDLSVEVFIGGQQVYRYLIAVE
ncbi:MAG: DAK2 domain-containing protein [Clostridia bacterium]|nr:DAK2 domain-containing protein [Clostridia bacterium]